MPAAAPDPARSRPKNDERSRIEDVYGRYQATGREVARWESSAPGNRCIISERRNHMARLLAGRPLPRRVLEVGCGRGTVVAEIQDVLGPNTAVQGIDLVFDRIRDAKGSAHTPVQADGRRLPFRDDEFDLVAAYTVFSSILDQETSQAVAAEIQRVLSPSGAVLWYDLRYPSLNQSVRPVGRKAIRGLFPNFHPNLMSSTLLPPLARALGRNDRYLYPWLSRLPAARSHLFGILEQARHASTSSLAAL